MKRSRRRRLKALRDERKLKQLMKWDEEERAEGYYIWPYRTKMDYDWAMRA